MDFVTRNVFVRAGMSHTESDDRFAIIPHRTRFYRKTNSGTVENADFLDSSYKTPGGGWLSSAEDMGRFEVAILNDRLLKRSTRDLMLTPLKPGDGKPNGYALGWGTFNDNGILYVAHSGGQQGTSTDFLIAPEKSVGVVVLANMEEIPVNQLSREILRILLAAGSDRER